MVSGLVIAATFDDVTGIAGDVTGACCDVTTVCGSVRGLRVFGNSVVEGSLVVIVPFTVTEKKVSIFSEVALALYFQICLSSTNQHKSLSCSHISLNLHSTLSYVHPLFQDNLSCHKFHHLHRRHTFHMMHRMHNHHPGDQCSLLSLGGLLHILHGKSEILLFSG